MRNWPEKALRGERQVVLLTGEAGIGKTTLVEAFLEGAAGPSVWIGRGQCLEHYGAGEDVLGQLLIIGHTQAEYSIGTAGLDRKAGAGVVF